MIEIVISQDLNETDQVDTPALTGLAAKVLEISGTAGDRALSLKITGDDEIRALNRNYLGKDTPTDVLSFPIPFDHPESGVSYLGDIVISLPTASRQAESAGHAVEDEIQLLLVHGILHLLGYDHATLEEKAKMWTQQDKILNKLGIQAKPTEY